MLSHTTCKKRGRRNSGSVWARVNSTQLRAKDCAGVSLADLGESYLCFHRCLPLFRSMIDNIKWDLPVHSSDQPQLLNLAWLSQRSMLLHDYPLSPYL